MIEATTLGAPDTEFFSVDRGWLTAISLYPRTDTQNILGPEYGQIFIAFGAPQLTSKSLILAQGIFNYTDGVFWTGRQLLENDMYIGFLIRSFGNTPFYYGYFIEQICQPSYIPPNLRTDKC